MQIGKKFYVQMMGVQTDIWDRLYKVNSKEST